MTTPRHPATTLTPDRPGWAWAAFAASIAATAALIDLAAIDAWTLTGLPLLITAAAALTEHR